MGVSRSRDKNFVRGSQASRPLFVVVSVSLLLTVSTIEMRYILLTDGCFSLGYDDYYPYEYQPSYPKTVVVAVCFLNKIRIWRDNFNRAVSQCY
jgi:hypothetical protein